MCVQVTAQKSKLVLQHSDIQKTESESQTQQAAAEAERMQLSIKVASLAEHQAETALAVKGTRSEQALHTRDFVEKLRAFTEAQRQYNLDQLSDAANIQDLQVKEQQLDSDMRLMMATSQQLESRLEVEHQARQGNLEQQRGQAAESEAELVKMQAGLGALLNMTREQTKLKKARATLKAKEAEREAQEAHREAHECAEEEAELERLLAQTL